VLYLISHARLWVHWAPGIPHALFSLGERFCQNSGASRRGIADSHLDFRLLRANGLAQKAPPDDRLREAIHLAAKERMDCFVASSSQ
jgi:hypothetical protein